jgi:hypothetical protein
MGIVCPCEVLVNAIPTGNNVRFDPSGGGTVTGDLTYMADLCSVDLVNSTLTLEFEDTEFNGENGFTFTATEITCLIPERKRYIFPPFLFLSVAY